MSIRKTPKQIERQMKDEARQRIDALEAWIAERKAAGARLDEVLASMPISPYGKASELLGYDSRRYHGDLALLGINLAGHIHRTYTTADMEAAA